MRIIAGLCFLAALGSVFYFSWLPDPDFGHLGFMPGWLAEWTGRHGNSRTAIPFIIMGFLYELLMKGRNSWKKRFSVWGILLLMVCAAEAGQLLLPGRYPSLADIIWGGLGTSAGMLGGEFINFIFTPEGE